MARRSTTIRAGRQRYARDRVTPAKRPPRRLRSSMTQMPAASSDASTRGATPLSAMACAITTLAPNLTTDVVPVTGNRTRQTLWPSTRDGSKLVTSPASRCSSLSAGSGSGSALCEFRAIAWRVAGSRASNYGKTRGPVNARQTFRGVAPLCCSFDVDRERHEARSGTDLVVAVEASCLRRVYVGLTEALSTVLVTADRLAGATGVEAPRRATHRAGGDCLRVGLIRSRPPASPAMRLGAQAPALGPLRRLPVFSPLPQRARRGRRPEPSGGPRTGFRWRLARRCA